MDAETIIDLGVHIILPLVVGIVVYIISGKNLDKAHQAYDILKTKSDGLANTIHDIISFFDPEVPYSETKSWDAYEIIDAHPYSYKLEDSDLDKIRQTCKDAVEYNAILTQIHNYEDLHNIDYTIQTTSAKFRVYYGTAVLIEDVREGLSQMSRSELTNLNNGKDTYLILDTIIENERKDTYKYDIKLSNCIIHVDGKDYVVEAI